MGLSEKAIQRRRDRSYWAIWLRCNLAYLRIFELEAGLLDTRLGFFQEVPIAPKGRNGLRAKYNFPDLSCRFPPPKYIAPYPAGAVSPPRLQLKDIATTLCGVRAPANVYPRSRTNPRRPPNSRIFPNVFGRARRFRRMSEVEWKFFAERIRRKF